MKNKITSRISHKTASLIAVVALGLALAPISSMASNNDRGHHGAKHSKSSGKHFDKGHRRDSKHSYRESHKSHKRNLGHKLSHERRSSYGNHHNYRPNKHRRYYPAYNHHYDHRGHGTTHYVVNDYYHNDHYNDFDRLKFMIGLHTNNFDITFRD